MRFLDQRLDDALSLAYERLSKRSHKLFQFRSDPKDLRDISQWQVDSAILFEGVNNALKAVRRPISRAPLSIGSPTFSSRRVGREHFTKTLNSGRHLPEDFGSGCQE
jgi:hypothetical protein